MKFVNLHAHTCCSIGDAISKPEEHFDFVIKNAGEDSMSMAVSDHGNASSFGYILQAKEKYKKKNIPFKPIFGIEGYIIPSLEDWRQLKAKKDEGDEETEAFIENERESKGRFYDPIKRRHHLVLIAYNQIGLKNIFKLTSRSYREGFYKFPRMDFDMLQDCNEGLIMSQACLAGLGSWITLRDYEKGEDAVMKSLDEEFLPLLEIFGKDRAYLELQFNKLPEQRIINEHFIKYAQHSGYKLVATADSHYPNPSLFKEREMYRLLSQQTKGWEVNKNDLPQSIDEIKAELYPKSGDQMWSSYKEMYGESIENDLLVKEAIERTYDIAHDLCEEVIPDASIKLPNSYSSPFDELKNRCVQAMIDRGLDGKDEYVNRLIEELKVIKNKQFSQYFLVLQEALEVIRKIMLTGPARGSSAGSLICYLLGINQIDPIKHNLLFFRFYSEDRDEPPDVDCDVEDKDLALQKLKEHFGEHNVLAISNYNTLQLKSLVKDVSKFFDIPFQEVNAVTTIMENEAKDKILDDIDGDQKLYSFSFEKAKQHSPSFQKYLEKYPQIENYVSKLFGEYKSVGKHAGGVCIVNNSEECMPVIRVRGEDQVPYVQGITAQHLDKFGLVKYDFLGLNTIKIIRRCIELILRKQGIEKPNINDIWSYYNKNLHPDILKDDDLNVIKNVYHQGKFPGIFQFTEQGVQNFVKRADIQNVKDISVITALWRPGALKDKGDKKYLDVAHDNHIEYDHPILEEILGESKSVLVYQEQFLLLAIKLAGFTEKEADKLRKILVKPATSLSEQLKEERKVYGQKFIDGCIKNGLTKERATHLWEKEILGSISYSFNKSHSTSYSYISYQCSWLLTYHENEWIRAYLELDPDRDKAIADVQSIGYTISKPNILKSTDVWELEEKTLFPSLSTIKGIGDLAVEELMNIRKQHLPFQDLYDLFYEIETKDLKNGKTKTKRKWRFSKFNKRSLEALIKLEAFDDFGIIGKYSPNYIFDNYKHMWEIIIGQYDKIKRGNLNFKEEAEKINILEWTQEEKIDFQTELLGTFDRELIFDQSVLDFFANNSILPLPDVCEQPQHHWFVITEIDKKIAKTGRSYYQFKITDCVDFNRKLNYFQEPPENGFRKNALYVALLQDKNGWLNVPFKEKVLKVGK